MTDVLSSIIEFIGKEWSVLYVSMLPYVELRGSIPMGLSLGLNPVHTYLLAVAGSTLPAPIILLVFRPFFNFVKRTGLFRRITQRIVDNTIKKSRNIKKYYGLGLFIFVAIPIPSTGVWTGSMAAALFNIRLLTALPAIFLGNAVAGLIVTLISLGVIGVI